jgi:uncharacterized protein (DUF2235 family)
MYEHSILCILNLALTEFLGLFGFSRGAYTARALAGMLNKVGLLPPDNVCVSRFASAAD